MRAQDRYVNVKPLSPPHDLASTLHKRKKNACFRAGATHNKRRAMADVPKLIASRLLEGWCMLNKSCEKDLTPLLRSRDGRELCVACERDSERSRAQSTESSAQVLSAQLPAAMAEPVEPVPPTRCFLPEVPQASAEKERTERTPAGRLWEVLVQGPDLKFCCTRLAASQNERPRLLADSFAVKVRLAAAVGVDTCTLQEAAASACKMLMHKILLPKLASGTTEMCSAKGQMCITFDGKLIFSLPEEDCQVVPHMRVTPESLAGMIWEELGCTALKSLKQVPDLTDGSTDLSSKPWWLEVSLMDGSGKETAMRRQLEHGGLQ